MDPWLIILIFASVTALLNLYRVELEDKNEKPRLQGLLMIVTAITGFLSLPATIAIFGIMSLYNMRTSAIHERELNSAKVQIIDVKNREIDAIRDRLNRFESMFEDERKKYVEIGYRKAKGEFREIIEHARQSGFEEGYRDGWQDHAEGYNALED